MNKRKEGIDKYNKVIFDIYLKHRLKCLRGLDREYKIDGKDIYPWYRIATEYFAKKEDNSFNFNKNIEDLLRISDEIMYFTANIILYEPFINDPTRNSIRINEDKTLYRNFENIYAKSFDMFTDICFEKLYNYWDRIGDVIAACIRTDLDEKNIYFTTVMKNIPFEFQENENFKWLESFNLNEFVEINKKRIRIVHYSSTGTDFQFGHLSAATDESKIRALMEERRSLTGFFEKAINNEIKGFQNTMDFLIHAQEIDKSFDK